jgi:transcriptional regulator with XRE-family HTH domain
MPEQPVTMPSYRGQECQMRNSSDHAAGDLGRRIADQRERTGLSREEAAARAGMAADYLEYLETSATPEPSRGALGRLADALGTTVAALGGAGLSQPPGQAAAAARPMLAELNAGECRGYLAAGGIGRFLFMAPWGPAAVPVNFRMLGHDVVFRTGARSSLVDGAQQPGVSFEVDHIDPVLGEGWSVLVSGEASLVTGPAELKAAAELGIAPWAGGDRDTYIRVSPRRITGRRIRASG